MGTKIKKIPENDLITVLIPSYNCGNYIAKLLESLLGQTNKNFKIILLNDGSTDNTEKIIKSYLNKFDSIRLISRSNKGLASTRNDLIKLCNTKYFSFIDSDDWVGENYIFNYFEVINKQEYDFIAMPCYRVRGTKKPVPFIITKNTTLNGTKKDFLINNTTYWWGHLYRTEFIIKNNLFCYDKVQYFEDAGILLIIILEAKNFYFLKNPQYYYYLNKQSLSRHNITQIKIDAMFEQMEYLYSRLEKISIDKEYTEPINDMMALYHCIVFTTFQFQSIGLSTSQKKNYRKYLLGLEFKYKKLQFPKNYWKFGYFLVYRIYIH